MRLYNVKHDAFSKINILSCYWAGFFAADGNVARDHKNPNKLSLELQIKDQQHLENFKLFVGFDGPTRTTNIRAAGNASNGKTFQYVITGKRAIYMINYFSSISLPRLCRKWQCQ